MRNDKGGMYVVNPNRGMRLKKSGILYILRLNMQLLVIMTVFFISAGTLSIPRAWVYFSFVVLVYTISSLYLARQNPELMNERTKKRDNAKAWDMILVLVYFATGFFGIHIIAGLDIGRFGWSQLSIFYFIPGALLYIISAALGVLAMAANVHFEPLVRIQGDRDHKVVKTGPYAIIRHPGYLSIILGTIAIPLMLGSLYTFFCSAFVIVIITLRTFLEDKTLQCELNGYSEYAREVKYRLIPLIW